MVAIDEGYIKEILGSVASVLNFSEWSHSIENFGSIGQNYFGVLVKARFIGKINDEEVNTPLVLKLAPKDERYRVSGAVTFMFAREIFMYSTVLNEYNKQQATLLTRFVIPPCYYLCKRYGREAIALKDMTAEGYSPYTHTAFLDLNHVMVSLEALASLHAHSFILKKRNLALYEEATKTCVPLTLNSNKRYLDILDDRLSKAMRVFKNTPYENVLEFLKGDLVKLVEAAYDSVEHTCICHGDVWKENILFKYINNKPVSACLIDYQTARLSSPAFDVLYLISSSTDTTLRRQEYQNLLDVYCQEFDKVLKEAGFESQDVYCVESFQKDLKTVSSACFIVTNCALWLANGLQQEGHVRSKTVFTSEEEHRLAEERYRVIVKDLIDDFSSYGYINMNSS